MKLADALFGLYLSATDFFPQFCFLCLPFITLISKTFPILKLILAYVSKELNLSELVLGLSKQNKTGDKIESFTTWLLIKT